MKSNFARFFLALSFAFLFVIFGTVFTTSVKAETIIDTFPDWDGRITSGWRGTAQTITTPADNVLEDYSFELAPRSSAGQILFEVFEWANGPVGVPLFSKTLNWSTSGGVVLITGINLTLVEGVSYGMVIDLLGYSGGSVHFNSNRRSYTGGHGWWTRFNGTWYSFASLNHKFRAVFDTGKPKEIVVALDIKPGGCENPVNFKSSGKTPVAILGSQDLDVETIDIASITLAGQAPFKFAIEDVANHTDCDGTDGFADLTFKIETQKLLTGIKDAVGSLDDGDVIAVSVSGRLLDGTAIVGEDDVVILKKGKK